MSDPVLSIGDPDEDRYATLQLIPWWDQARLQEARVIVLGAGALGNEVIKNLALAGVGRVLVADYDTVQAANLSRSVLFRESDRGRRKVDVVAERAREINPDVRVSVFHGDITREFGLGVYRRADLVFGCLDSRAARVAANRACWRLNMPWIDGALDVLMGMVRVFMPPEGACYECGMTEQDYALMNLRYSCPLLRPEDIQAGRMLTTPTSASIIGALQVQEGLKWLHGQKLKAGSGLYFNGQTYHLSQLLLTPRADCYAHQQLGRVMELDGGVDDWTVNALLRTAEQLLGEPASLLLNPEVTAHLRCPGCGSIEPVFLPADDVTPERLVCPRCGKLRLPHIVTRVNLRSAWPELPLRQIGIPPLQIVLLQTKGGLVGLELSGDAQEIFAGWKSDQTS